MKKLKLFPVALLMITLMGVDTVYPNDLYGDSHKSIQENQDDYRHAGKLWKKLPQEKRKLLHDAMIQAHKQNEPLREETEKLDKELDALLVAPDFDKNTYLNKSAKLGALHAKMKADMSDAFASVMKKFTPEERKILVELRKIRHHTHRHGEWHHDEHSEEWSHHHDEGAEHKPQTE